LNYNVNAGCDDGSCQYSGVPGCTDVTACNYDVLATVDDLSCVYPGCTDPTSCNYDATAGCDDASCIYPGCSDATACNYDASAGCDDGSCVFAGCTDAGACNFDVTAGCDDGSCTFPGCNDDAACNFDPTAGCYDGSCAYAPLVTIENTSNTSTLSCVVNSIDVVATGASNYSWTNASGQVVGTSAGIAINQPGTYTVTAYNTVGCTTSESITIDSDGSLPIVSIISTSSVLDCNTTSITLTGAGEGTYEWSNGLGSVPSVLVDTPGTYTLSVTAPNGCVASASVTITQDITLPVATITSNGSTVLCPGETITLTASTGASYVWNTSAIGQIITVNTPGSYIVQVTGANGCSAISAATVITQGSAPQPVVTANGPITFCEGNSVVLSSSSGSSYVWSTGATSQSITVTQSGSYYVEVTNASGCSGFSPVTMVEVFSAVSASVDVSGSTTLCEGQSVTLTSSPGDNYLWSNGAITQSINVTEAGTYSVLVSSNDGCTGTSQNVSVEVIAYPNAVVSSNGSTSFCQGNSVVLTVSQADSYLWSNGAITQSITVDQAGEFSVTTFSGGGLCSSTSNPIEVEVVDFYIFYEDADLDGFGDTNLPVEGCELIAGLSLNPGDCDDDNPTINPQADELCDGIDNNCDLEVDELCPDEILGCIDVEACNFNPAANTDDGTCTFPGCTDPTASNYDATAGCDDSSCQYAEGCIDMSACNYDPLAVIDNGTCTYPGCTNIDACNYDAIAGCDDGSCTLPGCTDPTACNYDATAGCDDGSCLAGGCTDALACNYNPNAACDDGSCAYIIGEVEGPQLVFTGDVNSYTFPCDAACEYLWTVSNLVGTEIIAGFVPGSDDVCEVQIAWGSFEGIASVQLAVSCDNGCSNTYEYLVQINDTTSTVPNYLANAGISLYPNPTLHQTTLEVPEALVGSDLKVYNSIGALVYANRVADRRTQLDAAQWAAGVYNILLTDKDDRAVRVRMIKE
jgi:hypothetical protein